MNAETAGVVGAVEHIGTSLITTLPAQFLVLIGLNAVFIIGLLWFFNNQLQSRERMFTPLISACVQQVPVSVVDHLLEMAKK